MMETTKPRPDVLDSRGFRPALWRVLKYFGSNPSALVGVIIVAAFLLSAVLAGLLPLHDPTLMAYDATFMPPGSPGHPLGTDQFGRDILSRLLYGSRTSLYVGVVSVALGCGFGALIGLTSGYLGGTLDSIVGRIMDVLLAFPLMVLAIAMVAALGPSTDTVVIAVAVPMMPRMYRVIRAATLSIKEMEFIKAAEVIGATPFRIITRHLLRSVSSLIIVVAMAQIGVAIVTEAGLGFLGLGTQEPQPSWGLMLSGSVAIYANAAPWIPILPGLALAAVVFGFNMSGDALRDLTDPHSVVGRSREEWKVDR